jgi:flagellar basal-body rod modification protein FlgD
MTTIDTASLTTSLSSAAASSTSGSDTTESFLKLLVTQLQNQDPLNPMDNAEMTSQLAQINTVSGLETVNQSIQALNTQFVQMQALQGASLVGRDVTVEGNRLAIDENGRAQAGFALAGPADSVRVDILDGAGRVVDTMDLGAQDSGRQGFEWDATGYPDANAYSFRVSATLGAGEVAATPLMLDRVTSVALDGTSGLVLSLERSGQVPYGDIHALN